MIRAGKPRDAFAPPFLASGLLCTLAISSVLGLLDVKAPSLAPAAFLGIFFAIFARTKATMVAGWTSAAIGSVGSLAALIELDAAATCAGTNVPLTLAWGALLAIIATTSWFFSFATRRKSPLLTPLALYGALEVLGFFALPLGISIDKTNGVALAAIVSIATAILLGALVGFKPEWTLFVFAALIALAQFGIASVFGTPCSPASNGWGAGAVAMYFVAYGVTHLITGRRAGRG